MAILVGEEYTFYTDDVRGQMVMPIDENTCAIFYQKCDMFVNHAFARFATNWNAEGVRI